MTATLTDLMARTDLTVITVVTAPACTNDRYVYAVAQASGHLTYSYMVRVADGVLVGRVRRDFRETVGNAVAVNSSGSVVARGDVEDCLLALWQADTGSLSPVARKVMAAAL